MQPNLDTRIVIVERKTRLQELIERFNTWPQAKFYLTHNDADPQDYLDEQDLYQQQLAQAKSIALKFGRVQSLERGFLPNYQFRQQDIVVVVGQDGLVANTLKYLQDQPVIGVNPDPQRWEGVLLPFTINQLKTVLRAVIQGHATTQAVTFAEVTTNDGQQLRAVNDLFIGPQSHTSARYQIEHKGISETQSSSGIIIATGFGSTGWLQSVVAGACGVTGLDRKEHNPRFAWDDAKLRFAVREPFPSLTTTTQLTYGTITKTTPLRVESLMPERGVIFSDGIEDDFIQFNAGTVAHVTVANEQGQLVMPHSSANRITD